MIENHWHIWKSTNKCCRILQLMRTHLFRIIQTKEENKLCIPCVHVQGMAEVVGVGVVVGVDVGVGAGDPQLADAGPALGWCELPPRRPRLTKKRRRRWHPQRGFLVRSDFPLRRRCRPLRCL